MAERKHKFVLMVSKKTFDIISAQAKARGMRIPILLQTPAAIRWLSMEPLLGPVDLTTICTGHYFVNALTGLMHHDNPDGVGATGCAAHLDWIVLGGESGPGARPMHPDWARLTRNQCAAAGVPFHFKQWGAWQEAHQTRSMGSHWLSVAGRLTPAFEALPAPSDIMVRAVGKKAAGRLLDGVEHNGVPA